MSGGVGRAQGGYDEMVFRAMVQDDAKFYDPLGLVSKGTEIDFQTGANAYLYGTRFMDYLAFTYGPQRLLAWWRRDAGSRRYYADQFQQVYGLPLNESWRRWIDWEHQFQRKNLQSVHEHPVTEFRDSHTRTLGAVSRSYLSTDGSKLVHGREVSRARSRTSCRSRARRRRHAARGDQGRQRLHGDLARLSTRKRRHSSTPATITTYRNLEALDLRTGKSRMLLQAARIGDIVFNPADRSLWGLEIRQRTRRAGAAPVPL